MNRFEELIQQGRLLFTPKVHPKYLNNKLRVFKPSTILKRSLVLSLLYAGYRYSVSLTQIVDRSVPQLNDNLIPLCPG